MLAESVSASFQVCWVRRASALDTSFAVSAKSLRCQTSEACLVQEGEPLLKKDQAKLPAAQAVSPRKERPNKAKSYFVWPEELQLYSCQWHCLDGRTHSSQVHILSDLASLDAVKSYTFMMNAHSS